MHYTFKSTPTCTFKSRTQTITKSNQPGSRPGPANYQVTKMLKKSASFAHTKEKRQLFKTIDYFPGPGQYKSKSYINEGPKRSMSARLSEIDKKSPGPFDYNNNTLKVKSKAPVFSMGNKSKSASKILFQHNLYKPSSVVYQSKSSFIDSKNVVIGTSKRRDLTETQKTPAPNKYMTQSSAFYASVMNPRCKFGAQKRDVKFTSLQIVSPGPAAYDKKNFVQENKQHKKGFSCRSKIKDLIALQMSKHPAPGQYQSPLKFTHTAPRPSTSTQKRKTFIDDMQLNKKQIPGPFLQGPQSFKSSKYRANSAYPFGISKRKPLDQNQKTPGPLAYNNQKNNVLKQNPKISSTKALRKYQYLMVMDPENPGPGNYDSSVKLIKQSTKQVALQKQKRPNFDKQKQKPGPGYYNIDKKQNGPTYVFPTQKRVSFTDLKNQAKFGKHYDIQSKVVDPPMYMKVESKIKFSPSKSGMGSTRQF